MGCIAVYKGRIIGRGYNSHKTHPMQMHYNKYRIKNNDNEEIMLPKVHAEIMCLNSIKNLDIDFKKVKIFVYRIRKSQPFGMARPCQACMQAIIELGIKQIYYTTDHGYAQEIINR